MKIRPEMTGTRVERRLAELDQHRYRFRFPVSGWSLSTEWPQNIPMPEAARRILELGSDAAAKAATVDGNRFATGPEETQTYWIGTNVEIPRDLEGAPVHLVAATHSEATVYVNGVPWQGLDVNRREVLLTTSGVSGERYRIDIMLFTGRDRQPKSLVAELVRIDDALVSYRHDLRTVLGIARSLPADNTTAIHLWKALESSMNRIEFHAAGGIDVEKAAERLRLHMESLRDAGHDRPDIDIHMVGNSHIDVTWLWTLAETRQKMGRTTATALRYMESMPEYRFSQSQAQLYEFLRQDFPQLFERVKERVREGRWEITGAAWVEPDCNIAGGEALVRQILYGQKFWREHFDLESNILWLPDTFGYAWALPQILRKSGIRTFATQKLTWNDTNVFPHGHFFWEGVDGSRIRCTFPPVYVSRTYPEEIMSFYARYPSKDVVPAMLYPYGYGDGGGGPVPEDIEIGRRLPAMPGFPRCRFSRVEDAVLAINKRADEICETFGGSIPVWRGELYLEFHRGTLTSNAKTKRYNRRCELALRDAEIWASLASILSSYEYPADLLERAWKRVLLNQFHDILPGTSIPEVYPEAYAGYEACLSEVETIRVEALEALATPMEGPGFSVVNGLGWSVCDWVEVTVDRETPFRLVDSSGREIVYQMTHDQPESGVRIGFEAEVPPFGCTPYRIDEGTPEPADPMTGNADFLDNGRLKVSFDGEGRIDSILETGSGREWLAAPGNLLQTFDDRPNNWEAWDLNDWYEDTPLDLFVLDDKSIVEEGPVRAVVRLSYSSENGSRIEQDVIVYRTIPRIDFDTKIDWQEKRVLLKAAFPVAVHSARATYEIQFGSIDRPVHRNTEMDAARFEVSGHKWIDMSEASGGVSLLNDCKYGHDVRANVMRISLLRNPAHPDARCPTPSYLFPDQESEVVFSDTGQHRVKYSFYPHEGDWRNGTVTQAYALNNPLRVESGTSGFGCPGTWRISDPALVVEALKRAEDGEGYILRVFESHGGRRSVSVQFPFPVASFEPVDLMERPYEQEGPVEIMNERSVRFDLRPFEIRSFRIRVASGA